MDYHFSMKKEYNTEELTLKLFNYYWYEDDKIDIGFLSYTWV